MAPSIETTYQSLTAELDRLHYLESTLGLLGWDEQVNLPSGSADHRAQESATLADIIHREATHPEIGQWLECLENSLANLSREAQTVVREARRDYDRRIQIPSEFVARKANAQSMAYHAWAQARKDSDFEHFSPFLEEQLRLAKEEAAYLGFSVNPYDYHIDQHDPGLTGERIEALFTDLLAGLKPIVDTILGSKFKADPGIFRGFSEAGQESFLRSVVERLGFDFSRGRIDRSLHPFCGGSGADTRMTTRFSEDEPLDSLFGAIHETGHGLYEQGLPQEHLGSALGKHVGMAVHESQSRIWENQVGRSRAFWDFWEPPYRKAFPSQLAGVSSEALYLAINEVRLTPIRVDADEVTYNLHIILRFNLERELFSGDLAVKDLPARWNELSARTVGLTPASQAQGVLQDIHWSGGAFGYFPSYCLGNMLAAQIWRTLQRQIDGLEEDFRMGEFGRLLNWLRRNIHSLGRQFDTMQLTERVTGQQLQPDSLLRYLEERYLPLYS